MAKGRIMEVLHQRCAGLDISKRDAKVCVRSPGPRPNTYTKVVTVSGATTRSIAELRDYLVAQQVTLVVMEATGDYWKPFHFILDPELNVMLVNARHARNLPGRKTDVSDAQWLAELGAHGLVRGSFVPPEHIRILRDLTRSRTTYVTEKTREIQRLEKLLEDACIKFTSVATKTLGASGRAILEALIAGERDPAVLAELAQRRLRAKIPALTEALNGRFNDHHAFAARMHLDHIDVLDQRIDSLSQRITTLIEPLSSTLDLLETIPGVSRRIAEVIVAETGADMDQFRTPAQLASWTGVCPGHNESAGKVKSSHARPGNSHLKGALGIAAMAASRTDGTYFQARYKRLTSRRGPMRALVAVEHSLITAIWHMLTNGTVFEDLGADHLQRTHESSTRRKAISQLHQLGYEVELKPISQTE